MGTKLGTTGTSTPHDSDMAYPLGMELHGSKWRIKKRVPQDLLRKHPDIYPSQFLTLKTDESDRCAAASKAWVWLGTLEEEFLRVRETGSKFKRVSPPGVCLSLVETLQPSPLRNAAQDRTHMRNLYRIAARREGSSQRRVLVGNWPWMAVSPPESRGWMGQ